MKAIYLNTPEGFGDAPRIVKTTEAKKTIILPSGIRIRLFEIVDSRLATPKENEKYEGKDTAL